MFRGCSYFSLLCLLVATQHANAQRFDTLKAVKVSGNRLLSRDVRINQFTPGQRSITIDSTVMARYRLNSLATLLSQQLPVYVRSYGFNGLATLTLRGASAAQSQVLWNGVPVQNPATGLADLSETPIAFTDRVSLLYGSSAALLGSGNVGGAILLESTKPKFDTSPSKFRVSLGYGSFNQRTLAGSYVKTTPLWYLAARVLAQGADNDFPYATDSGRIVRQAHSELRSSSATIQVARKLSEQSRVELNAWVQQYNRAIPAATFERNSTKQQKDAAMRLMGAWNCERGSNSFYAKSSIMNDWVTYSDAAVLQHADYRSLQYYQEIGWQRKLSANARWLLFTPVQLSWLQQSPQSRWDAQRRFALAGAISGNLTTNRLQYALNGRLEAIDHRTIALGGVNIAYSLASSFKLRTNMQRTYRAPTLNELYFFPGGNTALKPERGWAADLGYTYNFSRSQLQFTQNVDVFARDIKDWVIWMGGAVWTPHNIARVFSRGLETDNQLKLRINKCQLQLGVATAYTLSTAEASYAPNDGTIDKQLPYAPRYNARATLGATVGRWYAGYNHGYTGYRFVAADNSTYLPPYQQGNMQVAYQVALRRSVVQLSGQLNNLWNERYFLVAARPLPGRHWLLSVECSW